MDRTSHQSSSSGLATPPPLQPQPILTGASPRAVSASSTAADSSWRVVGSPPRRQLLSSPLEHRPTPSAEGTCKLNQDQDQDQQHNNNNNYNYYNNINNNSNQGQEERRRLSLSLEGTASPSGASSAASKTATTPRENVLEPSATHYALAATDHNASASQEHAQHNSLSLLTPTTPSPNTLPTYASSPSTLQGFLGDSPLTFQTLDDGRAQDMGLGLLEMSPGKYNNADMGQHQQRYKISASDTFRSTSNDSNDSNDSGSSHNIARTCLESPLSMTSFIWNGRVTNNDGSDPTSSLVTTLSDLTTGLRQEATIGSNQFFSMSAALRADPFVPGGHGRTARSLSLSEPLGFHSGFGNNVDNTSKHNVYGQEDGETLQYRMVLPTMEEESEDAFEQPRVTRTRRYSTSATFGPGSFYKSMSSSTFTSAERQDLLQPPTPSSISLGLLGSQDQHPFLQRKLSGGSTWPSMSHQNSDQGRAVMSSSHRRSITSGSYVSPIWESPSDSAYLPPAQPALERERVERQRVPRRFSLAPSSGFQPYDRFLETEYLGGSSALGGYNVRNPMDNDYIHPQRRHSVAGPLGSYLRPNISPFSLASSMDALQLDDAEPADSWNLSEEYDHDEYQLGQAPRSNDLGKGMTLSQLQHHGSLYVVEFKAGRSDLFYVADKNSQVLKRGDLVMVEADRGKDLGKITNDSISPQQIQALQKEHSEAAAMAAQQEGQRAPKEIHPKRIFRAALPTEISQLVNKNQDEIKAMMVCQTKVRQKKLPMEVVDAEYQWDRRKLTFYFRAEHRIDFRELVRDLFKIYKTRIWMYAVSPSMATAVSRELGVQSSPPRVMTSPTPSPTSPLPHPTAALHHPHHSSPEILHPQHPQQQYAQHQQNAGLYHYQQPQLQDLMRQMQAQYFSAPQQSLYQGGYQHDHHALEEEPLYHQHQQQHHQRPFYEQAYPLQPPHPLM